MARIGKVIVVDRYINLSKMAEQNQSGQASLDM
jgi:hypothetical protein